jgi:hypothetical protein
MSRLAIFVGLENNRHTMLLTSHIRTPFRGSVCIFGLIQKYTKKIKATRDDPQGAPGKKMA